MNINDLYSQAYALYKQGFQCELTKVEELENEEINRRFLIDTDAMNFIKRYFEKGNESNYHEFFNATDISEYIETQTRRKIANETIGKALGALGFERKPKKIEGNNQYGYYVLAKKKMETVIEGGSENDEKVKNYLLALSPQKYLITNIINDYNAKNSPNIDKEELIKTISQMSENGSKGKFALVDGATYLDIAPF